MIDAVEALGRGVAGAHLDAVLAAAHAAHRHAQARRGAEPGGERRHVGRRAALDRVPLRRVAHAEQPVVVEEADEEARRHLAHAPGRRRPDRGAHRRQEVIGQRAPVAAALEVLADREVVARLVEQLPRVAEEAAEIEQEAGERRPGEIAALREEPAEAVARELEVAALAAHRERHRRRTQGDAEVAHELQECGIVTFVANNETRIERMTVREYCVGVSTSTRLGLVQHHVAVRVETVRGGQPGDAGADDGDPHLRCIPQRRPQLLSTPGLSPAARRPPAGDAATKELR